MKALALFCCACCTALLLACTSPTTSRASASALFHDELFRPPAERIDTAAIFALDQPMRDYVHELVSKHPKHADQRRVLFEALYRRDQLQLDYDAAVTRSASQTFAARAGNCLSLAIMTAALARELKLTVQFQHIHVDDSWSRNGTLYFASNHVNLMLGRPQSSNLGGYSVDLTNPLTVDFIPISPKVRESAQPLSETTIVAMFLNNRAAELLADGHIDDAYWAARQALETDPSFLNTYNTLGVVYLHHGAYADAERILRYAMARAPQQPIYLANLVNTLSASGQEAEAALLRVRLEKIEPYPPFHFFTLGQEAMRAGDYRRARVLFQRELERAPDYHEFHYWMSLADYQLGDFGAADREMKKALATSPTGSLQARYSAKIEHLRAQQNKQDSMAK